MLINKIHICSELCKKIKVKLNMKKVIENTNQDKRLKTHSTGIQENTKELSNSAQLYVNTMSFSSHHRPRSSLQQIQLVTQALLSSPHPLFKRS